jgi:O-antigen ligase
MLLPPIAAVVGVCRRCWCYHQQLTAANRQLITANRQPTTNFQKLPKPLKDHPQPPRAPWRQGVAFWCLAAVLTGLFTFQHFRILSSLGIAALVVLACTQPEMARKMAALTRHKAVPGLMGIFLVHAITILYTDPVYYPQWWEGLVLKLPFLLLPPALALLGPWPARRLILLYYFFLHLVFLAGLYSLGQYFFHYREINLSYNRAGVIPTLVHHVRFSLMVAFAVCIGIRLLWLRFYWRHPLEQTWIAALTLFLFVFLHLLAVRSGLIAFYSVAGAGLLYAFFIKRKLKAGLAGVVFLLSVSVLSFLLLPTVKEKINYTLYDLAQRHDETKANTYSITGRLYSYRVGFSVWQQSPLVGWGMGDIHPAIGQTYHRLFPGIRPGAYLIPHNQLLYYLGLLGAAGLLFFLAAFYYPLVAFFRKADVLLPVHYLIITVSFLFEATLETQVGLLYALLFILLPMPVNHLPVQESDMKLKNNLPPLKAPGTGMV